MKGTVSEKLCHLSEAYSQLQLQHAPTCSHVFIWYLKIILTGWKMYNCVNK